MLIISKKLAIALKKQKLYKERNLIKRAKYEKYLSEVSNENGSNIIYTDEAGISKEPFRTSGWSPIGTQLIGEVSGKRHSRTSMIAGYSRHFKSLVAPLAYKGFTNAQTVIDWLENHLIPNLKQKSIETGIYNWVIVMDNAAFHTSLKIRKLIEDAGYKLLFLSPYSPDFNPIEHQWYILKLALATLRVTIINFYKEIINQLLRMSFFRWG